MTVITSFLVVLLFVNSALSDDMAQRNIMVYKDLVDSLLKRLAAEDCQITEHPGLEKLKRSLLKSEYRLKLIQQDFDSMYAELQKCRESKIQPEPKSYPEECVEAVNLTESWRSNYTTGYIDPGAFNCDTKEMHKLGRPWFRFASGAGNSFLNRCIGPNSCGTHAPIWSDDKTPKAVGLSTPYRLYGPLGGNCRLFTFKASIMKCSDKVSDFIYRYEDIEYCPFGFCGMNQM